MLVSEFDFDLPGELVAQSAAQRGTSKLLVLDRGTGAITHSRIARFAEHLRPGDLLVTNDTRVFAARLLGHRVPSGGAVECLLLERAGADEGGELWHALMHPGQKLGEGSEVRFEGEAGVLHAEVLQRRFFGRRLVRLRSGTGQPIDELIDRIGHVPLPPYIRRPDAAADRERYQTVYASVRGSVAAPTAGLHFTPAILDAVRQRGVETASLTLHVGYGTFKPVRVDTVEQHAVDPERYEISASTAEAVARARLERRRVVAVGTTTTRALEDAAIRGEGRVVPGRGEATVFIYPGFRFSVVGALLTNFHLPRSSLLMLVSAFAGVDRTLAAYREAIGHGYRFYSYGDAMLIG